MITSYFPRCGASTACERAGLPCLLVCYRTLARLLPQAKAQPALSHLRRGEDTYAIDATARSAAFQPAAVQACCTHWAAVDALTAVVRARPREAQGVGKKTRQCSELRRAWRRGTRGAHRRADERSRRSSTCLHRRPQCCCRRRHRSRWAAAGHFWTVRSRRPPHASSRRSATTKTTMDDNPRP